MVQSGMMSRWAEASSVLMSGTTVDASEISVDERYVVWMFDEQFDVNIISYQGDGRWLCNADGKIYLTVELTDFVRPAR